MRNKKTLLSNFRTSVAQMLTEHQNEMYAKLNQGEAGKVFADNAEFEAFKQEHM